MNRFNYKEIFNNDHWSIARAISFIENKDPIINDIYDDIFLNDIDLNNNPINLDSTPNVDIPELDNLNNNLDNNLIQQQITDFEESNIFFLDDAKKIIKFFTKKIHKDVFPKILT